MYMKLVCRICLFLLMTNEMSIYVYEACVQNMLDSIISAFVSVKSNFCFW